MSTLNLSNNIEPETQIVAAEHEQNYSQIENFVNGQLVHRDGTQGMSPGAQLVLGGTATSAQAAVPKSQLDSEIVLAKQYTDTKIAPLQTQINTLSSAGGGGGTSATPAEMIYSRDLTATGNTAISRFPSKSNTGLAVTIDPVNGAGSAIIAVSLDVTCHNSVGGAFVGELIIDGAVQPKQIVWNPGSGTNGARQTLCKTWILPVDNGSTTYAVYMWETGGNYDLNAEHSTLEVQFIQRVV